MTSIFRLEQKIMLYSDHHAGALPSLTILEFIDNVLFPEREWLKKEKLKMNKTEKIEMIYLP